VDLIGLDSVITFLPDLLLSLPAIPEVGVFSKDMSSDTISSTFTTSSSSTTFF
jgi:hypothetical protein